MGRSEEASALWEGRSAGREKDFQDEQGWWDGGMEGWDGPSEGLKTFPHLKLCKQEEQRAEDLLKTC